MVVFASPNSSRGQTDPAVRQKQLAAVISNEMKLRKASPAPYQPFVHWVHLNRDAFIDAIVILKQHDSSCALQSTCLGLIVQGRSNGFQVISSFPANHHPLYLAPTSTGTSPRTLYHSEDGDDYDEIIFSDGRYQVAKRGLSVGRVREQAYWAINEQEFDDLALQTADVEKIGSQPAGAPAIVRLPEPPRSLSTGNKLLQDGYLAAARLKKDFQQHFSLLASHQLLSHTVSIDLIPCDDWMTRVPLANQRDRSSKHVIGCVELLGLLSTQEYSPQAQYEVFLYLLSGTFGQALALQTNALEGVLRHVRKASQLTPENRNELEAVLTRVPWKIFYLLSGTLTERVGYVTQSYAPVLNRHIIDLADSKRGEFTALDADFRSRYTATLCAKRTLQRNDDQFLNNSIINFNKLNREEFLSLNEEQWIKLFNKKFIDAGIVGKNWTTCDSLGQFLDNHVRG